MILTIYNTTIVLVLYCDDVLAWRGGVETHVRDCNFQYLVHWQSEVKKWQDKDGVE